MYIGKKNADNTSSRFRAHKYGRMGEVIENNRTFVLPNERYPYSFKMKYTYDSWNRVQDITYPDGEVVYYKYNTGGMLDRVQGKRSYISGIDSLIHNPQDSLGPGSPFNPFGRGLEDPTADNDPNGGAMGDRSEYHNYTYDYINDIRYNEFELKSAILYGNGTSAQYSYDILNRLSRLKLYDAANNYLQNITYSYDAVGNIDTIKNMADRISGSNLGGTYTYTYKYDDLYRLTTAIGSTNIRVRATESTGFTRIQYASYTQRMRYDKDGKILSKTQTSRTSLNGSDTYSNTANDYIYNSGQPHTVRATSASEFRWDANGNMIEQDAARMSWDEENQLREYSNRRSLAVAFYQYDAGGERFYKNTGERTTLVVNGRRVEMPYYHIPTLYTSPYLVATPQGYTKHYFMESERFASRIGDGTITSINNHVTTASALAAKQAEANAFVPDSTQARLLEGLRNLPFNWSSHHTTFWQHGDHLGSASWITDTNGRAYQHLQYMAWGEPFINQRVAGANYEARFTFSGKERDEESGFSYFGARLHNPALSIWLSVDPMADKYPGVSPYVYCADNPVRLVDPDGRKIDPWNEEGEKALQEYFGQFKPRTIEKAFGLTKYTKIATTPYEADYIEYASNIRGQSKEEFIANMGRDAKRLSEADLEGAYSVYLALSSEDAYVVGMWNNQQGAYTTSPETTGGTTVIKYNEGYRSHGLMKTNTDFCEDIKTNNYIKFHPSRNTPTSKNYFSYEFNFYYNFEWPRYSDIRGVFLFDLYQNRPINIGNAFNVTNNKVDIGL